MDEGNIGRVEGGTYRTNCDIWIAEEIELVDSRYYYRPYETENPSTQCTDGHSGIVGVCDGGAYFRVGGFVLYSR